MKDGGPAFPRHGNVTDLGYEYAPEAMGMSLRDYFAAKAMQGMLSRDHLVTRDENADVVQAIVRDAFIFADAMLAERENDPLTAAPR